MGKIPYEIPDWRKWKVEDVPDLVKVQKMLAEKGLKDPWLRNEVWRYQPPVRKIGMARILLRGFQYGAVLFVGAVVAEKFWLDYKQEQKQSGH